MQNSSGMRATDDAESRRNWRTHGAKLGKWDPLDPKYDRDFASEIQEAVDGIAQTEDTEARMRVELLLSELLPPSHGAAAGDAEVGALSAMTSFLALSFLSFSYALAPSVSMSPASSNVTSSIRCP